MPVSNIKNMHAIFQRNIFNTIKVLIKQNYAHHLLFKL